MEESLNWEVFIDDALERESVVHVSFLQFINSQCAMAWQAGGHGRGRGSGALWEFILLVAEF
jgi:hypothetical protein